MYAGFLLFVLAQHFPARYGGLCRKPAKRQHAGIMSGIYQIPALSMNAGFLLGFGWVYVGNQQKPSMDAGIMPDLVNS